MTKHTTSPDAGRSGKEWLQDWDPENEETWDSKLAWKTLWVTTFALFLAWWMGRRIVKPVEQLRTKALSKVAERSPRADLAIQGGDEMQDLATAFNALLAGLEQRRGANEAFVADLVHEFKNPVATVRACADALGATSIDAERAARLSRLLK